MREVGAAVERALRSDAAANRDRLLDAATGAVLREGPQVPLARIAEEAGVGVATLYRRFPDRPSLMNAVQVRSYGLLVELLDAVLADEAAGIDGIAAFLDGSFALRGRLALPLHGADRSTSPDALAAGERVRVRIAELVDRGRRDGTLQPDVTPRLVVEFGALLVQGLAHARTWDRSAAEQRRVFLRGIAR